MSFVGSSDHVLDAQRRALITSLEEYGTRWSQEMKTIDRMIEFVSRQAGCFDRSTAEGHLTGAAWLIHPSEPKVLLTHHRKLNK